jgi:AraC family L-rhamnose operon regulatory protein RhaS
LTLSEQKDAEPFVRPIKSKDEMQSLFYKAAMAWQKKNAGYCEECFSDLYRIIKQIKKEALDYSPRTKSLERIMPALEYIDDNYLTENISVGRLASLCDTSEVYLRKKFREVFSESPAVYMRNKRIKYAKELLQCMEYSVTEVAMLSGFNDTSYFIREFKKAVGTSPSDYRK